jgi:hypothetical protein
MDNQGDNVRQPEMAELEKAESRQMKLSADSYEQREGWRGVVNRGDWWIALGIYAVLCSIAFVVL